MVALRVGLRMLPFTTVRQHPERAACRNGRRLNFSRSRKVPTDDHLGGARRWFAGARHPAASSRRSRPRRCSAATGTPLPLKLGVRRGQRFDA